MNWNNDDEMVLIRQYYSGSGIDHRRLVRHMGILLLVPVRREVIQLLQRLSLECGRQRLAVFIDYFLNPASKQAVSTMKQFPFRFLNAIDLFRNRVLESFILYDKLLNSRLKLGIDSEIVIYLVHELPVEGSHCGSDPDQSNYRPNFKTQASSGSV